VERRKSIYSPWGWGKKIDFQAAMVSLLNSAAKLTQIYGTKPDFGNSIISNRVCLSLYKFMCNYRF
jgi:hypothetical protein